MSPRIARRLTLEELTPRVTPTVTSAALSGGVLTIIADNGADRLALQLAGADIQLFNTSTQAQIPIIGSPNVANTLAVLVRLGGGADRIDVSTLPVGNRTILLDGENGDDTLIGTTGPDSLGGGSGEDLLLGGPGDDVLDGGTGSDDLEGGAGDDVLFGGDGGDRMDGDAGDDSLVGGAFGDIFTGGPGDDTFDGNTGADANTDTLIEFANVDFVITNTFLTGLGFDVMSGIESVSVGGGPGNNRIDASGRTLAVSLSGEEGDDTLIAGAGNDFLSGDLGNDSLVGAAGNDTMDGEGGNDTLRGGDGDDILTGELGNDSIAGNLGADLIREAGNGGFTLSNTALTGIMGLDKLASVERADLTGGFANDVLNAGAFTLGPVMLNGGSGNDTLTGGSKNDVLTGGAGTNRLSGGAGIDEVRDFADQNLILTNTKLTGSGPTPLVDFLVSIERASLSGGTGANTLSASSFTLGPVTLNGGFGNDTLIGSPKDDALAGDQGDDSLVGGAGNDTLAQVNIFSNAVTFTLTDANLTGNIHGTDTFTAIERWALTGGNGDDVLDASAFTLGPVTLDGGRGNDTLTGGSQNDALTGGVGDDSLTGGAGTDTVVESGDVNLFTLTDSSLSANTQGLGTDLLTGIENARLTGGPANNNFVVSGWTGTAVLDGAGGTSDAVIATNDADFTLTNTLLTLSTGGVITLAGVESVSLNGGIGNNRFTLTGFTGRAFLSGGGGTDTVAVVANSNFNLANVSLTAANGLNASLNNFTRAELTGGVGNNKIDATAFTGNVTLIGAAGNDTLIGGSGDDSLDGGVGTDRLDGGFGTDTAVGGEVNLNIP